MLLLHRHHSLYKGCNLYNFFTTHRTFMLCYSLLLFFCIFSDVILLTFPFLLLRLFDFRGFLDMKLKRKYISSLFFSSPSSVLPVIFFFQFLQFSQDPYSKWHISNMTGFPIQTTIDLLTTSPLEMIQGDSGCNSHKLFKAGYLFRRKLLNKVPCYFDLQGD